MLRGVRVSSSLSSSPRCGRLMQCRHARYLIAMTFGYLILSTRRTNADNVSPWKTTIKKSPDDHDMYYIY